MQTPASIRSGAGCLDCAGNKKYSHEEYYNKIKKLKNIIPLEPYVNTNTSILHKHLDCDNTFRTSPGNLLYQTFCPNCSNSGSSLDEQNWLENYIKPILPNILFGNKNKQKKIKTSERYTSVDGFDLILNKFPSCFEYYGEHVHGNPGASDEKFLSMIKMTNKEACQKTLDREIKLLNVGQNIFYIYSSDYKNIETSEKIGTLIVTNPLRQKLLIKWAKNHGFGLDYTRHKITRTF